MRRIEGTTAFRRDFKREKRGQHRREVDSLVSNIVGLLSEDQPPPQKNHDHQISGEWGSIANATSSPTCCSSTESRMRRYCNLFAWAHTANSSASQQAKMGQPLSWSCQVIAAANSQGLRPDTPAPLDSGGGCPHMGGGGWPGKAGPSTVHPVPFRNGMLRSG